MTSKLASLPWVLNQPPPCCLCCCLTTPLLGQEPTQAPYHPQDKAHLIDTQSLPPSPISVLIVSSLTVYAPATRVSLWFPAQTMCPLSSMNLFFMESAPGAHPAFREAFLTRDMSYLPLTLPLRPRHICISRLECCFCQLLFSPFFFLFY